MLFEAGFEVFLNRLTSMRVTTAENFSIFTDHLLYDRIRTYGPRINTGSQFFVAELQHQVELSDY